MDIKRLQQILNFASIDELLMAYALAAINNTKDMLSDFISDPEYVKTEGFPSRDKVVCTAVDQALVVLPSMISDNSLRTPMPTKPAEMPEFEYVLRSAITELVRDNPSIVTLEYQPR